MLRSRLVLSLACAALIVACVPSPTATPPRATPFPTLPVPTDTPLPPATLAPISTVPPLPSPSPKPTLTLTSAPLAVLTTTTTLKDSGAPLLQVFPQSEGPLSLNQALMLGVIAADDGGLARFELYDDKVLYASSPAPAPPPRTLSTILTWKPDKAGPHRLRVLAYDVSGNASAPVDLAYNVVTDNRRPSATLLEPLGAIEVPVGAPMVLQGVATDDVAVTRVDLIVDYQVYTYLTSDHKPGESPFAVAFMWVPTSAGSHKLSLRAHDTEDQTEESAPLIVNATALQAPALTVSFERNDVQASDSIVLHAVALSANGIARMELWADNEIADAVNSSAPDTQTSLDAPLVWQATTAGEHALFVRAYDRAGLNTSSAPQVVRVYAPNTPVPTITPLAAVTKPTVLSLKSTPTPEVILPTVPTITVTLAENPNGAALPGPLHVRMVAHGAIELDQVELWSYYQGETMPELLFADNVKGSTDKTLEYAWTPLRPGAAFLFARVLDHLGQTGQSPVVQVLLQAPAAPTATPAFFGLGPNWQAVIPTNKFAVSFVQLGSILRGTFTNTPLNGTPVAGSISSGVLTRDRVAFSVVFEARNASPRTLDFDCLPQTSPAQLACNYQDEAGNRGSAVFSPAP